MGTKIQITVDCTDVGVAMAFWAPALGYQPEPPPAGHESWAAFAAAAGIPRSQWRGALVDPAGAGPRLFFHTVPEPEVAENRWHLDVEVTDRFQSTAEREAAIAAKVAALVALGATSRRRSRRRSTKAAAPSTSSTTPNPTNSASSNPAPLLRRRDRRRVSGRRRRPCRGVPS